MLKECGFKAIAWMNQTHSTKVCKVTMADTSSKIDADAIVTNEPGLGLAVMTADCLPVILADEDCRCFCCSALRLARYLRTYTYKCGQYDERMQSPKN